MKNTALVFLLLISIISVDLAAQTVVLEPEKNHSTVGFGISIAGFSRVYGRFLDYDITIDYVNEDITQSKIKAVIDAASIDTGIDGRDDHLRTADFFDIANYPQISFESAKIFAYEDHYLALGNFSMHGITKEILLPFEIVKVDGNTIGFKIRTQINRIDFGVGKDFVHDAIPNFLSDLIDVEIDFWTKKKKSPKKE